MLTFFIEISFLTGVVAGLIDTIVGGGGLINLPVLLSFNLSPIMALGTNRLQGCIGELTSSLKFFFSGHLPIKKIAFGFFVTIIGSALGSFFDEKIAINFLGYFIPFILLFLILFLLVEKKIKKLNFPTMRPAIFFGIVIGFYNGFFGPSTGTFWIMALASFLKLDLKQSIMRAKPLNFIGNLTSLIIFMSVGSVSYSISIAMGAGQIIGAYTAAHFVIKKDVKMIKNIFLILSIGLMLSAFHKIFYSGV